jgi:hypothetical protein
LVKTENFDPSICPFPLSFLMRMGLLTFASQPDAYAEVPVYVSLYLKLNARADRRPRQVALEHERLKVRYFGYNLKEVKIGEWAADEANRRSLWNKLEEVTGMSG